MKWLESIVAYLSPSILLDGTPWKTEWLEREKRSFILALAIWFGLAVPGYIGHYFFFDRVNGLEPLEFWLRFRVAMATAMLVGLGFYLSPLTASSLFRLPAIVLIWLMCFTQAHVAIWYSVDAWIFGFIFVIGGVLIMRMNPIKSLLFSLVTILTIYYPLMTAGLPLTWYGSASVVTLLFVAVIRGGHLSDVRNYMLEQQNAAAQKQIIELNLEFADRIRAFIPKVIAERLEALVNEKRFSILQASVEVLRPETKNVACLFSDIRGFTQGSKNLQSFVNDSVMPEVRACSDAIEKYAGIPRKIGDLVFAYFDDNDVRINVLRSLLAGIEIAQVNEDMNQTVTSVEVKRFILLSAGPAVVGNIGGLDSSMEITALGSPVNFLSRLDDATKIPQLAEKLSVGDILMSEEANSVLLDLNSQIETTTFDLTELGIEIRDFPETRFIYSMRPNENNYEKILGALEQKCGTGIEPSGNREFATAV